MSRRRSHATSCRVATPGKVCCFCGLADINELEYGKIYELGNIVTHYYCLLLSSMMQQKGRDDQGILGFLSADIEKEVKRGKRLVCYHCKKNGATLGCCNTKCKRIFHLPCGLKAGSLHQFYSEFRSYCINHRPKQLIDGRVLEEVQNAETTLCYICYDNVNYRDILAMLWAPCCKKNAFFHRKCVQQLANSSGYFFKCPLCNNKKEFQEAMLEHGIFIPSQDASWELVPNAFQELLYRHNKCDAETCVCPKGRNHSGSNAKWELVLCQMCGSQGIHRHCGHLKWTTSLWECDDCRLILDKSSLVNRQNQSDGAGGNTGNRAITKDIDSDSDLSVGHDSHDHSEKCSLLETNIPIVRVRPGPLSYKMKEVMKVAQSQPMTKGSSSSLEGTNSSSSLPTCENGNKNDKDPKTVILIDSDEEADVIEIISEKQSPKVLTTNDGKKIQILEKREIDKLATTNKNEKLDEPSKLLSKDSKPIITSIQTVNNILNQKYPIQMPPLTPIINKSAQNKPKDQFEISPNSQNSIKNSQIISNQYLSRLTMSGSNIQEMSQFTGNFNQKISINSSSQEKITENFNPQQYFTSRSSNNNNNNNNNVPPQIFHLRSIESQVLKNRIPTVGESIKLKNCPPLGLIPCTTITENSSNQMSIPSNSNEKNKNYSTTMNNLPKISMNENDSMGIKILNVCSLAPDLFEKLESQDEGTRLKRKAETTPGTSQCFDVNNSVEFKRTRLANDAPALTYLNEWREKLRNREAMIKSKNKNSDDTNDMNIMNKEMNVEGFMQPNRQTSSDWRKTVEIWKETKTIWKERREIDSNDVIIDDNRENVKHPILKSLIEQTIVKGKVINDNAGIMEEQPSTSNIQKKMNVTPPSNNAGFYVDRGKSQDVLKVGGNNGACISWDSSNSVKGMQSTVRLFPQSIVLPQSMPSAKSDSKQKIKSPLKQTHNLETTQSKTSNLAASSVTTQKPIMNSTKIQAPVIQLD
ncbi:putative uncharacterized protein DDB_G0277255 isoform X2 [Leptopilina heterotoma]|uniref:putative uncharacterized protein DDB_G0277255 isoform X2 n=1 Tax=Leptopilina heterotoma TaxID=63436 RepID=UPI001CAA073C|nr:putative uncharacterized protein DDB_G0277255 isoform X2 [Leptopilina heterotoma]